jgi:hypothetical protein
MTVSSLRKTLNAAKKLFELVKRPVTIRPEGGLSDANHESRKNSMIFI